jgi:hypothetical protein
MSSRWHNVTYVTFGLSILLSIIEQEPLALRINSNFMQYVNQALELLGAMSECKVASKIRDFARDFVNGLLKTSPVSASAILPDNQDLEFAQSLSRFDFGSTLTDHVNGLGYDVFNFDAGMFNWNFE